MQKPLHLVGCQNIAPGFGLHCCILAENDALARGNFSLTPLYNVKIRYIERNGYRAYSYL